MAIRPKKLRLARLCMPRACCLLRSDFKMNDQSLSYNESSKNVQGRFGLELLANKLPEPVQPGWKIADLGCGTGLIALKMADMVGADGLVVAVDPNSQRIDYLKQLPEAAAKKNLILVNQAAEKCNFKEFGLFNLMFSNVVIHWIPEEQLTTIYQSAFDSLYKGGYLAIVVAEMSPEESGYRRMFHTVLPDDVKTELFKQVFYRPLDWYLSLLERTTRFTLLEKGYLTLDVTYASERDFFSKLNASMENLLPFEAYFSRESMEREGFYTFQPDGSITGEIRFSFFIARKDQ